MNRLLRSVVIRSHARRHVAVPWSVALAVCRRHVATQSPGMDKESALPRTPPPPTPRQGDAPARTSSYQTRNAIAQLGRAFHEVDATMALEALESIQLQTIPVHDVLQVTRLLSKVPRGPQVDPEWDTVVGHALAELTARTQWSSDTLQRPINEDPAITTQINELTALTDMTRAVARREHTASMPAVQGWATGHRPSSPPQHRRTSNGTSGVNASLRLLRLTCPPVAPVSPPLLRAMTETVAALITANVRCCDYSGALRQFLRVQPWARSIAMLIAVAPAYVAHLDGFELEQHMDQAVAAGLLEHKYASTPLNVALIEAQSEDDAVVPLVQAMARATTLASGGAEATPLSGGAESRSTNHDDIETCSLSPLVLGLALRRLSVAHRLSDLDTVLDLARIHGIPLNGDAVASIMAAQYRQGDFDGVLATFADRCNPEAAGKDRSVVNNDTLGFAMDALADLEDGRAVQLLHKRAIAEHRQHRIRLSQSFMTRSVRAHAKAIGVAAAENAFVDFQNERLAPSAQLLALLEQLAEQKMAESDGLSIETATWPSMQSTAAAASDRAPTEPQVLNEIRRLLVDENFPGAVARWERMVRDDGIQSTDGPYATLLDWCARRGTHRNPRMWQRMADLEVLAARLRARPTPVGAAYVTSIWIKALVRQERYADAVARFEAAVASGIAPHPSTQGMVLDAAGRLHDAATLDRVAQKLVGSSWGAADINVWTSLVEAWCRLGRWERATNVVFHDLPRRRPDLNPRDPKLVQTLLTVNWGYNQPWLDRRAITLFVRAGGFKAVEIRSRHLRTAMEGAIREFGLSLAPHQQPRPYERPGYSRRHHER